MTLPDERARSLIDTKQLLWGLAYEFKKIPKDVREKAKSILRHYPWDSDIEILSTSCPDLLSLKASKNDK